MNLYSVLEQNKIEKFFYFVVSRFGEIFKWMKKETTYLMSFDL